MKPKIFSDLFLPLYILLPIKAIKISSLADWNRDPQGSLVDECHTWVDKQVLQLGSSIGVME